MSACFRSAMSQWLHGIANAIHKEEHTEIVEVLDEWEICRCRVEVIADEYHHVDKTFQLLPPGWAVREHGMEGH